MRRGELPGNDREDAPPAEDVSAALRALLEGVVDYAGLFPPAGLDVPAAARNYAAYRASADRWMLGRFVVGIAKLPELRSTLTSMRVADTWPVTVVAPDAAAATSVLRAPDDARVRIESVETRARSAGDVALIARAAPKAREVYVEIPTDDTMPGLLDAIATGKLRAKIRTGGVTPDAIPPAAAVVAFIRGCLDRNLPFKATAGLHHPLRGSYPLTYEGGAPTAEMFGYLNVFLATVFMRAGLSDGEAAKLLVESDPGAIVIEEDAIRWGAHAVDTEAVRAMRARLATSFGSCSFREPVEELPFPVSSQAPA
ncbi:MAG TPA: hypothetical protein VFO55_02170 [Gemmatimonadaceae bacterium]|nr:hypothetical protein [Gemmatimonadaceae bacterium]